ncbi:energy-coupling factor ABC transporter ATP-binding protein [Variovorax sp. YR216]|uniref:energy-coupling factor ABC transporter ATP-binding protein n=1 Tax=Variovorax sp. YR216 TaxID=1882828 RepID=UPI000B81B0C1|nr:ABC transporter ATP-binding protein [Variovorax sp. YR216]
MLPEDGVGSGVRIEDVTLVRGHQRIFEGLTLDLRESRIGLIGDNGAGKSSLFRLISGLDKPQQGHVILSGSASPGQVGLLFQNPDDQIIFPTVAEELVFSLTARGETRQAARQRALDFLAGRGLSAWAGRSVGELSQGQRQQVCLMALQISEPQTLLLDEPYASLDLPSQSRLAAQIDASRQQIILSTHLLEHVHDFERVLWLEEGRVRVDGPGRAVCEAYAADVRERARAEAERGSHA